MFCFRQSLLCCISIQLCLLSAVVADSSPEDGGFRQVCNSTGCQDRDASLEDQNYEFYDEIEVCTSKECRATAARWHEAMDLTADPCQNFFQYACGGFIRKHASDERWHRVFNLQTSVDGMNFNIKNLLLGDSYEKELRQARERFVDCIFNRYLPEKVTMEIFNEIAKQCTSSAMEFFEWELASAYIKQDPHEESIGAVLNMMDTIKFEFWQIVKNSGWMDEISLNETFKKVQNLTLISGYHPLYLTKSENQKNRLASLQSPFYPSATYFTYDNEIFVPLLIMSRPYFNLGLDVLDYGAIGVVIGHEFAEMFAAYNIGVNGKIVNSWPTSVTRKLFKRDSCIGNQFIEEFKKFLSFWGQEDDTEHINHLGENVADYAGLKAAFYAYKQLNGPKRKLVDFENYSTEQLFFVSNAHLLCASESEEYMKATIIEQYHSPSWIRANLPMANFDEFAKAWGCTLGTNMNPHKKCVVW